MTKKLSQLKGLGSKSEAMLNSVGIFSKEDIEELGVARAFLKVKNEGQIKPSLNLLYAMLGAIKGEHWLEVAKHERSRLLAEIDGYEELEEILKDSELKN